MLAPLAITAEKKGETEFLTRLLVEYADNEHQTYAQSLHEAEVNYTVIKRAIWLMVCLIIAALLGMATPLFPFTELAGSFFPRVSRISQTLLVGSTISLLSFVVYRLRLERRLHSKRQECRHFLAQLLESRLGVARNVLIAYPSGKIERPAISVESGLHCPRCNLELQVTPAHPCRLPDVPATAESGR